MNIRFILVEPKVPENIGASARAIKTMGFSDLVLVNPCEWKEGKSRWVAHGSHEILENAQVFNTLASALDGSDYSIATSTRKRIVKQDIIPAEKLREHLLAKKNSVATVSVVFGGEESGLSNDDMRLCDITSSIAMKNSFPSLNLSKAVMLFAYELSELQTHTPEVRALKNLESYRAAKNKVISILQKIGLQDPDNRYGRVLERLAFLGDEDIHLVHSLCTLISEKIDGIQTHSGKVE